jgi:tellurite resistance protein TerA
MAIDYTKRTPSSQQPAAPAQPAAQQPPAPASPPVNLGKITLTKASPTVSLAKAGTGGGTIKVNLNWAQGGGKSGFFGKKKGVDLDLRCLYELADGTKSGIGALDRRFGSLNSPPFIQLDQDDRSGNSTTGENMFVNLADPSVFRRILIWADIYSGTPNWAAVDGVVTIESQFSPPIEVRMDSPSNNAPTASIALIEVGPQGVTITRSVDYFSDARKMDKQFRWGMNWGSGSK